MSQESDAELIGKLVREAKVFGLPSRSDLPQTVRSILVAADTERRLLDADEVRALCSVSGVEPNGLLSLQGQADSLVNEARQKLLIDQPELVRPGGALYPESRAEACWRDCYHFLRISFYAVAAGNSDLTDPEGMQGLRRLYEVLGVPIPGLLFALKTLRSLATDSYAEMAKQHDVMLLDSALAELQQQLSKF